MVVHRYNSSIMLALLVVVTLVASDALAWDGPDVQVRHPEDGAVLGSVNVTVNGTAMNGSTATWTLAGEEAFREGTFVNTSVDAHGVALATGGVPPKFGGCAEPGGDASTIIYDGFHSSSAVTVEMWIYYKETPTEPQTLWQSYRIDSSGRWGLSALYLEGQLGTLLFSYLGTSSDDWKMVTTAIPEAGEWHHVMGSYGSSGIMIAVDGQRMVHKGTTMSGRSSMETCLGHRTTPIPRDTAQVLFDELRVSTVQRYTSDFTPPGSPFTTDGDTYILDHLDGSTVGDNDGFVFHDIARGGEYVSPVHDSGAGEVDLHRVDWLAGVPSGTLMGVFLRSSPSPDMLGASDWSKLDPGDLGGLVAHRYLQFRVTMNRNANDSPRFSSFSLEYGGVRSVQVSLDGEQWVNATGGRDWTANVTATEGINTALVRAWDVAMNLTVVQVSFLVDITPPSGRILVADGQDYVNTREVGVRILLDGEGSATHMIVSTSPDLTGANWVPYRRSFTLDLGAEDGKVEVFVKVRDLAGHESEMMADSVILDTRPPTGSMTLGDGSGVSLVPTIALDVDADDENGVVSMRVGSSGDLGDVPWMPFTSEMTWDLGTEEGLRSVHVQVVDPAGNVLGLFAQVLLDLQAPTVSITIGDGSDLVSQRLVVVHVDASDANGLTGMRRASDLGSLQAAEWTPLATSYTVDLGLADTGWTEWVEVRDAAARTSTASAEVTLDITPPTGTVVIAGGAEAVHDHDVILTIEVFDATSGVAYIRVSSSPFFTGAVETAPVPSMDWTMAAGDGVRTVWLQVVDLAGHVTVTNDTVIVATVPPEGSITIGRSLVRLRDITVSLEFVRAVEVALSEYPDGEMAWKPVDPTADFTLSGGDGNKTVHAWFRDAYGLVSERASATVVLDTSVPDVAITGPDPGKVLRVLSATFSGTASDANGIGSVETRVDGSAWEDLSAGEVWSTTMSLEDWGKHTLRVRVTDLAGNMVETEVTVIAEEPTTVLSSSTLAWPFILMILVLVVAVVYLLWRLQKMSPPDEGGGGSNPP